MGFIYPGNDNFLFGVILRCFAASKEGPYFDLTGVFSTARPGEFGTELFGVTLRFEGYLSLRSNEN